MQTDKIPDEIMREAREIANCFLYPSSDVANECAADIARALMARDARLQEQVETLRKERDEFRSCLATASGQLMVAEAERDRLREMTLRAADQCDKWVKETYDGGWSTHQVRGQCALAESLRLAALQKEPQP